MTEPLNAAEKAAIRREALIKRIRALRNMTVERGASESEAMFAAETISRLLDEHDLSEDEIAGEKKDEAFTEQSSSGAGLVGERLVYPAAAIAKLTGTRTWKVSGNRNAITFFGRDCDVEIAFYLLSICENAMERALEIYRREVTGLFRPAKRLRQETAFLNGMALRLRDRLLEIHEARRASTTGTALVVAKEADVDRAIANRGLKFRHVRVRHRTADDDAYDLGRKKADDVALSDGVRDDRDDVKVREHVRGPVRPASRPAPPALGPRARRAARRRAGL